jgi:D-methionine transport system substrate-binding protein
MNMKKSFKIFAGLLLAVSVLSPLSAKPKEKKAKPITVAIPNDTTNEARALLLLQEAGYITLKPGAGITATPLDVKDNPNNFQFKEVEAAQIPNVRRDVNFALINANYAIGSGLNPSTDALAIEGSSSAYVNIIAVKAGNENKPEIKALAAAVQSAKVKDYIAKTYKGGVISVVKTPNDGYDPSVDYAALKGKTISVAASPTPHAEILQIAKEILAAKGITLKIIEFNDYVQPNNVVESGEVDANYFQHIPYLNDFNKENGTHLVSVAGVHVEPFGLYAGKTKTLKDLKKVK